MDREQIERFNDQIADSRRLPIDEGAVIYDEGAHCRSGGFEKDCGWVWIKHNGKNYLALVGGRKDDYYMPDHDNAYVWHVTENCADFFTE